MGPNDVEVIAPGRPSLLQPHPEDAIRVGKAGSGISAKGYLKLVAEDQVFKGEGTPRAEAGKDTTKQEDQKLKHSAG